MAWRRWRPRLGLQLLQLADGGPDAVRHRRPGPLHGAAGRAGLVAHPQGGRQVVDEGVELDLALVRPGQVVVVLGLLDLLLQLPDAPLVLAPGGVVEDRARSTTPPRRRRRGRGSGPPDRRPRSGGRRRRAPSTAAPTPPGRRSRSRRCPRAARSRPAGSGSGSSVALDRAGPLPTSPAPRRTVRTVAITSWRPITGAVDLRERHQLVLGGREGGDRQGTSGGGEGRPGGVPAAVGQDRGHVDEEAGVGQRTALEQVVEQLDGRLGRHRGGRRGGGGRRPASAGPRRRRSGSRCAAPRPGPLRSPAARWPGRPAGAATPTRRGPRSR